MGSKVDHSGLSCIMSGLLCLKGLALDASSISGKESHAHLVQLECSYYHYLCDGVDDQVGVANCTKKWTRNQLILQGWGCGYRTIQSLCSWAVNYKTCAAATPTEHSGGGGATPLKVPTIQEIQSSLVAMGDKPPSHIGSKEWLGAFEASILLDHLYQVWATHSIICDRFKTLFCKVPCKILHMASGGEVMMHFSTLKQHFKKIGSPIMIGML